MKKIAIIGGGAAGLMAAARIMELSSSHEIFLIERNKILGKKVIISGGGRCNLTTGLDDLKEILKKYPRGPRFLRTAMYAFPPVKMREWMQDHGVPIKIEEDMRVFPKSDNGMHVVRAFETFLKKSGVQILFETALESVKKEGDKFVLSFDGRENLLVDKLILAPGGQAYRHTGSKGDGYSFAESLGHNITALGPSLNAFVLAEKWIAELSGLSFKNVALSFRGKEKFTFTGPIMLTHKGITGPAVFALSAYSSYEKFDVNKPAKLFVDFFPEKNHEELQGEFSKELDANLKKSFNNILSRFVPRSFAEIICKQLSVDPKKISVELSKKDLNKVIDALKNMSFTIIGRSAGDEFVTAGGVDLSEVSAKTMESKICSGLYFAGEILDYDGFTGGFNLQAAWASGRLAGENAATVP
ncbi:aminoacetone oxidase family FAD-binding enzyme [Candidatus Peregrinibacteria bacterium]|jgi:predicted Rossmann fold flavoprotein|nr:aminoacetone oxidase family FAD-binding enzyme [Candidatus Peregrinibacteria bacterium]MBT4632248.1 aminoacetone oxidase family FAD-binding enzyme [Candidatus Peregrinibacteria bacterium]MBT5516644.1 aminoacetone oxidase family FAD-binding enzyme [Candidatus Peregrinibacteria bacterium]MBT5824341.1 aminoacetone oxidase family FAD-binding enzyme [Candidatus Peregrinibacteria bacterium]